jgi:hypothetical protein
MNLPNIPPFEYKLPQRSEIEMSEAVQECAKLCLESDDPQECARQYVAKLIEQGWSEDDAREVLIGALGVFARLRGR